jgi:hypothetical protein
VDNVQIVLTDVVCIQTLVEHVHSTGIFKPFLRGYVIILKLNKLRRVCKKTAVNQRFMFLNRLHSMCIFNLLNTYIVPVFLSLLLGYVIILLKLKNVPWVC